MLGIQTWQENCCGRQRTGDGIPNSLVQNSGPVSSTLPKKLGAHLILKLKSKAP